MKQRKAKAECLNIDKLIEQMQGTELEPWIAQLEQQVQQGLDPQAFGKISEWLEALQQLAAIPPGQLDFNAAAISVKSATALSTGDMQQLEAGLKKLMPWRKGPYSIHGVDIDTEWRSDYKWQRLESAIQPLQGKVVLDVGCGNGYHSWRMLGMGAELVIGIDPSPLFIMQFQAIKHFLGEHPVYLLPIGIEQVPQNLRGFDTVFSMGVFYHRKSPMDHLYQLKQCLKPGGELVFETLVIIGDETQVLMPQDRYAQMRNVWFIPSAKAMMKWLQRCGFKNIKLVDESYTGLDEQRSTDWMHYHSLKDFLDPQDSTKTIEGHPAPLRAIFTAQVPL